MRVGIDATSVLDEGTGLENHVLTLVDALARHSDDEIVAFVRRRMPPQWHHIADRIDIRPVLSDNQAIATQVLLPRAARRARLDVLYCGAKPAPAAYAGTLLVGIHDPIPWMRPDVMGRGAAPWFRSFHRVSIIRGATICTPTEASRQAICQVVGVSSSRVHVMGNALVPWYGKEQDTAPEPEPLPEQPFVLVVGRSDPRRGLDTVLDAWDVVRKTHPHLSLVMAGKTGWKVGAVTARARSMPGVVMLGAVGARELSSLYRRCVAFITASVHEGFGLTVLEAMAHGAPVIASAIPPHLEVAGTAAMYFSMGDWAHLAARIQQVVDDSSLNERLRTVVRAQAAVHSTEAFATRWRSAALAALEGRSRRGDGRLSGPPKHV